MRFMDVDQREATQHTTRSRKTARKRVHENALSWNDEPVLAPDPIDSREATDARGREGGLVSRLAGLSRFFGGDPPPP